MLAVWVTNGLRQQNADERGEGAGVAAASGRGSSGRAQVESALGKVGTLTPGRSADGLPRPGRRDRRPCRRARVPDGAAATLKQAQADAKTAIDALKAYDAVRPDPRQGVRPRGRSTTFLNSQDALRAGARALLAGGGRSPRSRSTPRRHHEDRASPTRATDLQAKRRRPDLQQGWSDYQNALSAGGISTAAPEPDGPAGASAGRRRDATWPPPVGRRGGEPHGRRRQGGKADRQASTPILDELGVDHEIRVSELGRGHGAPRARGRRAGRAIVAVLGGDGTRRPASANGLARHGRRAGGAAGRDRRRLREGDRRRQAGRGDAAAGGPEDPSTST